MGGVPPPEAFDTLKRRPPPNLPGPANAPRPPEPTPGKGEKKKRRPAPEGAGETPPPEKKKRPPKPANPTRLRRRRRIAAVAAVVLLIGGGVLLSVNLLFKIKSFDVEGDSPYSLEEIAAAFGHAEGDAMYGFSAQNAEERIAEALPYIEAVSVRRRLPSTILFRVTPATEAYALPWEGGFAILSGQRKVLRLAAEAPEGLMQLRGLSGLNVTPGLPLALTEEAAAGAQPESGAADSAAAASESKTASQPDSEAQPEEGDAPEGEAPEDAEGGDASDAEAPAEAPAGEGPSRAGLPAESFAAMDTLLTSLEANGLDGVDWVELGDPLESLGRANHRAFGRAQRHGRKAENHRRAAHRHKPEPHRPRRHRRFGYALLPRHGPGLLRAAVARRLKNINTTTFCGATGV